MTQGQIAVSERRRDVGYRHQSAGNPIAAVAAMVARRAKHSPASPDVPAVDELRVVNGKLVLTDEQQASVFSRHKVIHPTRFETHHMSELAQARMARAITVITKRQPSQSVILFSTPEGGESGLGCGKSTLARMGLYYSGEEVAYSWVDGLGAEGVTIQRHGHFLPAEDALALSGEDGLVRFVWNTHVIAIDDVGRNPNLRGVSWGLEEQAEERRRRWHRLIDACVRRGVGMIFTTNMGLDAFKSEIGESGVSRLREAQVVPVCLTGVPDYRTVNYVEEESGEEVF